MRFDERALLKVYLEHADLERLGAKAKSAGKLTGEYAREVLLRDLGGAVVFAAIGESNPAVHIGDSAERSADAPARVSARPNHYCKAHHVLGCLACG